MNRYFICAFLFSTFLINSSVALADESRWDTGLRYTILASQGEPSNDMQGVGLVGHYRWKDKWYIGFGIDLLSFDYENIPRSLGISPTEVTDTVNDMTQFSGWVERRYGEGDGKWSWFWTAGLGYATVDTQPVSGSTTSGGTFFIVTDISDEFQLLGSIGLRYAFSSHWRLEGAAHIQHHFSDYKLVDTVSGQTGTIGSHTPVGAAIGINYQF